MPRRANAEPSKRPELWACPRCGRTFANVNQAHACGPLTELDRHFVGASPAVRATFDRIVDVVTAIGPVTVLPEKTRVALHVRMSFAAFQPRRRWLNGHIVLARRIDSPRSPAHQRPTRRATSCTPSG